MIHHTYIYIYIYRLLKTLTFVRVWLSFCFSVDHCLSMPCQNNATCQLGSSGYLCGCPVGYIGIHCEFGELYTSHNQGSIFQLTRLLAGKWSPISLSLIVKWKMQISSVLLFNHIFHILLPSSDFKDGPLLIFAQLDRAGQLVTTIAFQFRTSKRFWYRFYVRNWNVIVVTSWPVRPSCAQNQLRTVLK